MDKENQERLSRHQRTHFGRGHSPVLAQEPIPVIRALKGENAEMREEQARNNRAASGQVGSSRDLHKNMTFFFFFLTSPHSLLDAISPTGDQRQSPCSGGVDSTTGPPGKPHIMIHDQVLQELRPPPGGGWDDAEFNPLSLDSVDLCPSSVLNSLLKPSHISIYP